MVDTVGEDKSTNAQVEQSATVCTAEAQPAELLALLRQLMVGEFKVIVFFVTARLTQLFAELFNSLGIQVLEMHSRKSQPQRTRVAEQFREGSRCVMFTSDVSARGEHDEIGRAHV